MGISAYLCIKNDERVNCSLESVIFAPDPENTAFYIPLLFRFRTVEWRNHSWLTHPNFKDDNTDLLYQIWTKQYQRVATEFVPTHIRFHDTFLENDFFTFSEETKAPVADGYFWYKLDIPWNWEEQLKKEEARQISRSQEIASSPTFPSARDVIIFLFLICLAMGLY